VPSSAPPAPAPDRPVASLAALAAVLAAGFFALALRPAAHVFDMPLTEDGYYALAVARNIARGNGITIDGEHWTSGFQPLFTFLQAAMFWLADRFSQGASGAPGDDALAVRFALALHFAVHAATALLIGLIARDGWDGDAAEARLRFWLAAALWLAAPLLFNHGYNGLETGAVLFFYAACWRWVQTGRDESTAGLAGLGALAGLTVLTRIDAVFLVAALCLRELWPRSYQGGDRGPVAALLRACLLGATAVLVSLPWWLYNLVLFGSPMPSSGTAQQAWAIDWDRIVEAFWAAGIALVPWVFAGGHESTWSWAVRAVVVAAYAVIVVQALASGAPARAATLPPARRGLGFAAMLAAALAALALYYTLSFAASWFYYRYFAPLALLAGVFVPIAGAAIATRPPLGGRAWRGVLAGLAALAAIPVLVLAVLAHRGAGFSGNAVFHDQVALAREHVPPGERVAAGQTGTLGFFRDRVVNLDGKVNRDALAWQAHMWDYLAQQHVVWFCDWQDYAERYLGPDPAAHGWRLVATRADFRLYRYGGAS
jgi:hypothetical protein